MSDCKFWVRRIFVLNKLEEFSLPAYLKLKVFLAKMSGIYLIGYSAWGLPSRIRHRVVVVCHLYTIH